ncbi:dihydroxyacetone kinase subunit DhaL [Liquorilactobacillus nagelii]|uniref:dihydroxyacetone kinase subunit DhaL n=1 Tax=Liquorilactobacillus nagelii TaxID=82688 RepID=UPI0006F065C3|nr:dihydroxyacetone kinase subunit DhaL [Liquorilactobacillus nagelii]KRL40401.1 dihydroxyacetone kinase, L subunit [Liquorilactobacillus nagelii DSM 13675]QYH54706.1 dihydroxyacetone kinase subunit L [Liquorilactobacillus nagelii DSM 13675]
MELTLEKYLVWMKEFAQKISEQKDYLSDLDSKIGDGDHGNNMARGLTAVNEGLKAKQPADLTTALKVTAMALISKVGGTAGPLYGTAFLEMAKLSPKTTNLGQLLKAATAGLKKRGGAQMGDKTMVDVWLPITAAVKDKQLSAEKIKQAVESTKPMEAKKGRASYLGERSIGHLDPGAVSSGYLFEALLQAGVIK